MKFWKKIVLVAVPSVLIIGSALPVVAHADEMMTQQQAQEMLSTYGEAGLADMGVSAEQLGQIKTIAGGGMVQPAVISTPPAATPVTSVPLVDAITAKNLLANFGVAELLGMGITLDQLSLIQLAAGTL